MAERFFILSLHNNEFTLNRRTSPPTYHFPSIDRAFSRKNLFSTIRNLHSSKLYFSSTSIDPGPMDDIENQLIKILGNFYILQKRITDVTREVFKYASSKLPGVFVIFIKDEITSHYSIACLIIKESSPYFALFTNGGLDNNASQTKLCKTKNEYGLKILWTLNKIRSDAFREIINNIITDFLKELHKLKGDKL